MRLALYQPDIPQNCGAAMRLCAALGVALDIIEPCGFVLTDTRVKRAAMDYADLVDMTRYSSWNTFYAARKGASRIVLLTTQAQKSYTEFEYRKGDVLLAGRESGGVPDEVHDAATARVRIPMVGEARSLNVVTSCAIVLGEGLRQLGRAALRDVQAVG